MFMHTDNQDHCENVCWLVPPGKAYSGPRYKSSFAAKVRWDIWAERKGCCKTIGPPPKVSINCPEHFLRKHSRQVPVFFRRDELKGNCMERKEQGAAEEARPKERRVPPLDTGLPSWRTHRKVDECEYPQPPSELGLFRSRFEDSYEQRYKLKKMENCNCDQLFWEDLVQATECAGVMAAEAEKRERRKQGEGSGNGPVKDYIRANAVKAVRMPPRRLRRCYVDICGVHLIDMSDSPYVLRPGFGKVPSYICKRKMQLFQQDIADKQQINAAAEENCRFVPDHEREAVLQGLKQYWAELLNQFNALPLNDTGNERQRELKSGLETKMKEVESDIRLLTGPTMLFVGDVNSSQYL
ncbi:Enkurin [Orchesella cincta]|uniref:Enkurin n=1 Tax=Orchesella cincta TaxID=48709 RepID=A0A1D2NII0_ORCCI|nr:Enkurin [Orchesella cincta]